MKLQMKLPGGKGWQVTAVIAEGMLCSQKDCDPRVVVNKDRVDE